VRSLSCTHLMAINGAHTSAATAMMSSLASMLAVGPNASQSRPLQSGGDPSRMSRMTTCRTHMRNHTGVLGRPWDVHCWAAIWSLKQYAACLPRLVLCYLQRPLS
jgi:hypothetical protein